MVQQPFPFDAEAVGYDADFSSSVLGRRMRRAVWDRLESSFTPGLRVLELGCGTGEDAVHLARQGIEVVATDRSPAMVEVAQHKATAAGVADRIQLHCLPIEEVRQLAGPFDGLLSNFGALNCVEDLPAVAEAAAAGLRPGARAVLCVMGPVVPWEWLWFLLRGQPRSAFRRLRPGGVDWRGLRVRYPSIGRLRRAFASDFLWSRVAAVGALLPPSYAEPWAARHPRTVDRLDRWERRFETVAPLPWLADHYLAELERRPT